MVKSLRPKGYFDLISILFCIKKLFNVKSFPSELTDVIIHVGERCN